MPIRITFNNETIEVDVTLDEWNRAYQQALEANTMVEIQEPDGRILSINPRRVDAVQTVDPPQSAPTAAQAVSAH
jgi:hypothetical protein